MIDLKTAKNIIETNFPESKPTGAYMYKDKYYLIVAPSGKDDANDPFYIVDASNGDYRFLNPLEDIDSFNKSIERGPIQLF